VSELKALMAQDHISPSDLLNHKRLFWKYLDFYQFDTQTQMNIFSFMMQKPVTGFNTINQILSPLKIQVPLDSDFLRPYLRFILGR
jgi:hypothetical protein